MTEQSQIDDRAAAVLCAEAGLGWDEAQRLVSVLRGAKVLRTPIDVRRVHVSQQIGKYPWVELEFENGAVLAGSLSNDLGGVPAWSNPFLPAAPQ